MGKSKKIFLEEKPEYAKSGLRAFRKSTDLEQFYRFIHDHGLRREAHHALSYIFNQVNSILQKKKGRGTRAKKLQ